MPTFNKSNKQVTDKYSTSANSAGHQINLTRLARWPNIVASQS